jgi:hypothetical protein
MARKKQQPPAERPRADAVRNRIVGHRKVRASELKPHALNPRTHGDGQRSALRALLEEVGLARSVLAYVAEADRTGSVVNDLAHAPLTLIDGHLRREELGDEEVSVEVLDVTDAEARKLLISLDPMAQLAGYNEDVLSRLRSTVSTSSDALSNLWASVADGQRAAERAMNEARRKASTKADEARQELPDRFLVIIECPDERSQVEALRLCKDAGLNCKAVMS